MGPALFLAGLMSWYGWSANVRITGMRLPTGTLSIDIWGIGQRAPALGGPESGPWMVGILLMAGGLALWRKCEAWGNAGGGLARIRPPWRPPPRPSCRDVSGRLRHGAARGHSPP